MHLSSHLAITSMEAEMLIFAFLNFSRMIDDRCAVYKNLLTHKHVLRSFCMPDAILALGTQQWAKQIKIPALYILKDSLYSRESFKLGLKQ